MVASWGKDGEGRWQGEHPHISLFPTVLVYQPLSHSHLFCLPFPPLLPPLTVWSALIATSIITLWRFHSSTLQPSTVSFSCQSSPESILHIYFLCKFSQDAHKMLEKSKWSHLGCIKFSALTMFLSVLLDLYSHFTVHGAAPKLTDLLKYPVSTCTSLHSQDNSLFSTEEIQARMPPPAI